LSKNELTREVARRKHLPAALWLVLGTLLVYNLTRTYGGGCGDEAPNRLIPLAILQHGTLTLNAYRDVVAPHGQLPYWAVEHAGALLSAYPPATGLLALPVYLLLFPIWNGQPLSTSMVVAKLAASLMAALSVGLVYAALRRLGASLKIGLILAGAYAIATPVYSIASQSLCQHPAATLPVAALAYCAVRARNGDSLWPTLGGLAAGAAMAIRPQTAPAVLPLVGYLIWKGKGERARVVGGVLALVAAELAYNMAATGQLAGAYALMAPRLASLGLPEVGFGGNIFQGVAGLLFSPGRGLFVFAPVTILAVAGATRAVRRKDTLMVAAACGVVATVLFYGKFSVWWGGWTFGPRYLTEVMPLVALLWYPLFWPPSLVKSARWRVAFISLAAASVFVQFLGAYSPTCSWNARPVSVDVQPQRNWDFVDSPISRCVHERFR